MKFQENTFEIQIGFSIIIDVLNGIFVGLFFGKLSLLDMCYVPVYIVHV